MSGRLGYYLKYFSELPEEWKTLRLDKKVVDILPGYAFESHFFDETKGIQLIRVRDIGKNKAELCYTGDYDRKYLIQKNDILIGMDGEYVVAKWNGPEALLNQRVCKIESLRKDLLDNEFLYFAIKRPIRKIEVQSPQTTVKHLSTKDIREIQIPLPPLPEQQKIASILLTVDEVIQKTDEVIGKSEMLKRGLMQMLLTRGIRHSEFKQTEVGEIPKEWDVAKIGDLVVDHKAGIYKKREFYGSGHNIVGVADLYYHDSIDGQIFRLVELTPEEYEEYSLEAGDLIYGESSLVYEGIGKALVVTSRGEGTAFAWHTRRLKVDKTRVNPYFLHHALNANYVRKSIMRRATRTAITGITVDEFFKTKVPLPNKTEQREIAERISSVDKKILIEKTYRTKLEELKKGLMQNLLLGKVRVKVD